MRDMVMDLIEKSGLDRIKSILKTELRLSVRLRTEPMDIGHLSLGQSRIGGMPDLPLDIDWPINQGTPLAFIAQINLRELMGINGEQALPDSGYLYFFYDSNEQPWGFDPKDRGAWKVIYVREKQGALVRASNIPKGGTTHKLRGIKFQQEYNLPGWESIVVESMKLDGNEIDLLFDLQDRIANLYGTIGLIHRLLGHPDEIQGEMQLECQLASRGIYCGDSTGYNDPRRGELEKGATDWRLLLQIDSDDDADMMWGDCGRIYFWVEDSKLKQLEFGNTWLILQCT